VDLRTHKIGKVLWADRGEIAYLTRAQEEEKASDVPQATPHRSGCTAPLIPAECFIRIKHGLKGRRKLHGLWRAASTLMAAVQFELCQDSHGSANETLPIAQSRRFRADSMVLQIADDVVLREFSGRWPAQELEEFAPQCTTESQISIAVTLATHMFQRGRHKILDT